ncbi:hypothetical protein V2J09_019434 [Rumex salicifolius]
MAAQGTSPPATSPPSCSNSQSSSTYPISHPLSTAPSPSLLAQPSHNQERSAAINGVKEEVSVKPDIGVKFEPAVSTKAEDVDVMKATEPESSILSDAESEESIKKYKKYEADYSNLLMAKYFSKKDIYGDEIFEVNFPIGDDASIRASRRPCMRSYADPLQSFTQPKESTSSPVAGMVVELLKLNIPSAELRVRDEASEGDESS